MTVADHIRSKLQAGFAPLALEVADDSARHAGHAGAARTDGGRGETHFTIRIVSAAFEGLGRVERQRSIYAALAEEIAGGVHALSVKALTPLEVQSLSREE
jgi:BolA protein